jgi:CelD/BcsL family acetyltransferase involved in cellulose biosynthesis
MREQMRSIIQWAFENNLLQLSFFTVDGKKAAAYLCLDYQDRIWVYNSGFDPQFREYSPGWVLLAYLIQHAIETGKHTFDFMRGDEEYKYRFGAQAEYVLKVQISR